MKKPLPLVDKGEIIVCRECGTKQQRVTRDLFEGETFEASMIESLTGLPPLEDGDSCECPECGEWWWNGWVLTLERGDV